MSCKDKDGGTHHNACDCREAYIKELESRIEDLLSVVKEYRATLTGAVGRSLDYLIERSERKNR